MAVLPTNYKDPILDTSVNPKKLFKLVNQATQEEMTVTIEDITTYLQIASTIGAGAFNLQNQEINSKLTASTLVGTLTEVLALTAPGSVADALVLKEMNTNFQDGCSKIASAITANGVTTASNASPTTMATNISNIRSGGTATAAQILSGYSAISKKATVNGSMPNRGAWIAGLNATTSSSVAIPYGCHNGGGYVYAAPIIEAIYSGGGTGTVTFGKAYKYVIFTMTAERDIAFAHGYSVTGNYSVDREIYHTSGDDLYVLTLHMWDVTTGHSINFTGDGTKGYSNCFGIY